MNSSYLSVDTMTPVQNDLVSSILTIKCAGPFCHGRTQKEDSLPSQRAIFQLLYILAMILGSIACMIFDLIVMQEFKWSKLFVRIC